jgi:hypothetical protein
MLLDSDPYRWVLEGHLTPIKQLGESTFFAYKDSRGFVLN